MVHPESSAWPTLGGGAGRATWSTGGVRLVLLGSAVGVFAILTDGKARVMCGGTLVGWEGSCVGVFIVELGFASC